MFLLQGKSFGQLRIHSVDQIDSLQKMEQRIALVFINTDWCVYCENMKNTTFQNIELINLLNDHYWFISFDAEYKKSIVFNGNKYDYIPSGNNTGVNELTEELAMVEGKLSFPIIVAIDQNNEVLIKWRDFMSSKDLLKLLKREN